MLIGVSGALATLLRRGRRREQARREVEALIEARQWRGNFFGRVLSLVGVQFDLRRVLKCLRDEGRREGLVLDFRDHPWPPAIDVVVDLPL